MSTRKMMSLLSLTLLVGVLSSCGAKETLPEVFLLTGECRIEVSTPHPKAKIMIDGIYVGIGRVSTSLPCGEKQVRVEQDGFKPYRAYLTAQKSKMLLVPVKLEPKAKPYVFALSKDLIQGIRENKFAKGAVEGGASAPAASTSSDGGAEAAPVEINWEDWS